MYKIKFLLFLLLGFCNYTKAQYVLKNDTVFLKNRAVLTKSQNILLGKGTRENGDFKYIEVNIKNLMRHKGFKVKESDLVKYHALSNQYNNKECRIIRFVERGKNPKSQKIFAIIGVGDLKRYQIELDEAIKHKEIIIK